MINDYTETEAERGLDLATFPDKERELLKDATAFEVRTVARLTHPDLERMIVGHLVGQPIDEAKPDISAAEKIVEAQIKTEWFEDRAIGGMFEDFMSHYRQKRSLMTVDEAYNKCIIKGQDPNNASNYKNTAVGCHAIAVVRAIDVDILIERMTTHYLMKRQNQIWEKAQKDRNDPAVGPRKSWENMREACIRDLLDPKGATIKAFDLIKDAPENMDWLRDMKYNPEKYRGMRCGINAIDLKTMGFRPGQLTVFVGYHGGYKTTTMLNVGYGLWENGCNVLYVSLEMEPQIVQTKLLCRGTKGLISYSRVYNGGLIEPEDFDRLQNLAIKMVNNALPSDERDKAKKEYEELNSRLQNKTKDTADIVIANKFFEEMGKKKNKFVVATVGQSEKMKLSQLERWLYEQAAVFKPDVVILDYLDLLQPEVLNPNRLDVGFGDICKMARQMGKNMGFSAITAAQMKRGAVERLRKTGLDAPEKAQFGTDDISGSGQIGADADNAFVLWRKGQNEVQLFTIKSRYAAMDNAKGDTLQVDYESCTIAESNAILPCTEIMGTKSLGDAMASAAKMSNRPLLGEDIDDNIFSPTGGLDMENPDGTPALAEDNSPIHDL